MLGNHCKQHVTPPVRSLFLFSFREVHGSFGLNSYSNFLFQLWANPILAGAIGEEAIRALLLHEGISFESMPDRLFEVADMKLAGYPWYIDGKHYSDWTMGRFTLPPTDPAWHPKLNDEHFKRRAQEKLAAITAYHSEPGKLIYINLTSHYPRPLDYYTGDFQPVGCFAEASIIVVQGALLQDAAALPQHAFELFCRDLKRA